MTVLAIMLGALAAFLTYRNFQLEKRWRAYRYCWQAMSDFACDNTRDDGVPGPHWEATAREQTSFMRHFGASAMTDRDIALYEAELINRDLPILIEHKA